VVLEKIKDHFENKKFARITRKIGKGYTAISRGYIVDYSNNFLILQEDYDFQLIGYNVLPVDQIKNIRFNKNDKYYHKIMIWEGEVEKAGISYKIDLESWQTVFKSIKNHQLNVIVECENPAIGSFTIGPILKANKKLVYIQNFDPGGFLDEKHTTIDFESITKVQFDDRYANIFGKYLRHKKSKK